MKFQDIFVPRWQHSNPEVRRKAVGRINDLKLLGQIIENEDDEMVRLTASERLAALNSKKIKVEA